MLPLQLKTEVVTILVNQYHVPDYRDRFTSAKHKELRCSFSSLREPHFWGVLMFLEVTIQTINILALYVLLKGIRICHLKICHFGIRIILRRRQLRMKEIEGTGCALCPPLICHKAMHVFPLKRCSPLPHTRKRRKTLTTRDRDSIEMSLHK